MQLDATNQCSMVKFGRAQSAGKALRSVIHSRFMTSVIKIYTEFTHVQQKLSITNCMKVLFMAKLLYWTAIDCAVLPKVALSVNHNREIHFSICRKFALFLRGITATSKNSFFLPEDTSEGQMFTACNLNRGITVEQWHP